MALSTMDREVCQAFVGFPPLTTQSEQLVFQKGEILHVSFLS